MRRDLERGLNPFVVLPPQYLFAIAIAFQLAALVGPASFLSVALAVLTTALAVGLVALAVLLVDYTTAPVGSPAHRVRGVASAVTSTLVVGFALAWCVHSDVAPVVVLGIEVASYLAATVGARWADRAALAGLDSDGLPVSQPG